VEEVEEGEVPEEGDSGKSELKLTPVPREWKIREALKGGEVNEYPTFIINI